VVHLLEAFDEYIVGYSESKYILELAGAARSQPPGRDTFNHVVLLDGQLIGRWRQIVRKDSVLVEVAPYDEPNSAATDALESAADAFGRFLGLPAAVVLSPRS
jgi:Winged helix DNA-binding domain